jgi:hypothetical protein
MYLVHEVNPPGPSDRTDLDVTPHVRPTLRAVQVTDEIQALFPELKGVQDIEPIRTIFSEFKAIQANELMSLGGDSLTSSRPNCWLQSWMMTKKDAAICLCVIFLDTVNQLPPPWHRPEFDPASFLKGANGK